MAKQHRSSEDRAEKVTELHQQLAAEIDSLVASEGWAAMLEAGAKFHRYSPNNVLLILRQCPTATRVAGYRTWQSMGRQVRKGEKGIAVLAPCRYKVTDESTGDESYRLGGFKVEHVFDLAQTDGEPIADVRPTLLEGKAPDGLYASLINQIYEAGFTVEFGTPGRGANGTTDYASRIVCIRDDVSTAQQTKTLAHELAHVMLHDGTSYAMGCRGIVEVEAESVAYIVASASGMSTESYSLPYVAHWANGDAKVVADTAQRVMATARLILEKVDTASADQREMAEVAA